MEPAAPAKPGLSVRHLPPNIFAMVMATGIVSLGLNGAGYPFLADVLFWLNAGLYAVLWVLLLTRVLRYRAHLAADLRSHAKAPGFFTLVAAPCVLGNQCVLLFGVSAAGLALWVVGVAFWLALTYAMVPGLMEKIGGGDAVALVASINVGSHVVDVSPLSTLGALCIANASKRENKNRLFHQLLLYGLSMSVVGAVICYVFFGRLG